MLERFGQVHTDLGPIRAVLEDGRDILIAREGENDERLVGGYKVKVKDHKVDGPARINVSKTGGPGVIIRDFALSPGEERLVNGMGIVINHLR